MYKVWGQTLGLLGSFPKILASVNCIPKSSVIISTESVTQFHCIDCFLADLSNSSQKSLTHHVQSSVPYVLVLTIQNKLPWNQPWNICYWFPHLYQQHCLLQIYPLIDTNTPESASDSLPNSPINTYSTEPAWFFYSRQSNPNITAYMAQHNITGDYSKLEQVYITKLLDIVASLPNKNGSVCNGSYIVLFCDYWLHHH